MAIRAYYPSGTYRCININGIWESTIGEKPVATPATLKVALTRASELEGAVTIVRQQTALGSTTVAVVELDGKVYVDFLRRTPGRVEVNGTSASVIEAIRG